jgi:DNA-directed RNA polymerase subunit RPC12/RpoP
MADHIDIAFKCMKCGKQVFWKADHRDNDPVVCGNCGHKGPTLKTLKKASLDAAKKAVEKLTGKGIKWK